MKLFLLEEFADLFPDTMPLGAVIGGCSVVLTQLPVCFVPVLCGVEPRNPGQRTDVEMAPRRVEKHRFWEAHWTLQQGMEVFISQTQMLRDMNTYRKQNIWSNLFI